VTSYLLDTHALLWWMDGSPLSADATSVLSDEKQDVYASAASLWELSTKSAKGILSLPESFLHH
jgi:PIN domain nuclease of toxin-antitoxin system